MRDHEQLYGLMMAFDHPEPAASSARALYEQGYRALEAFTPFPVEGMPEALGCPPSPLPKYIFFGGLFGGIAGYGLQLWASAVAYPLVIGGRPLNSIPAFIPITFETTILAAAFTATLGMLIINRLPRLHHPVFNVPEFERASVDRFFVCIRADDPAFAYAQTKGVLETFSSLGVYDVML